MADTLAPLIRDFLAWVATAPRPYAEVMESWRTSCPRLTVWEDAVDQGLVSRRAQSGGPLLIELTPLGRRFLADASRAAPAPAHDLYEMKAV
jgi:hypothetical protein